MSRYDKYSREDLLERIKQLERDNADMWSARQTLFKRCRGCGHIAEEGIICPTNQRGGNCEDGK